jgi:hypothetical protein
LISAKDKDSAVNFFGGVSMAKNMIGEKLKEMGKKRRWLSKKTGISKSTIARLVNND